MFFFHQFFNMNIFFYELDHISSKFRCKIQEFIQSHFVRQKNVKRFIILIHKIVISIPRPRS